MRAKPFVPRLASNAQYYLPAGSLLAALKRTDLWYYVLIFYLIFFHAHLYVAPRCHHVSASTNGATSLERASGMVKRALKSSLPRPSKRKSRTGGMYHPDSIVKLHEKILNDAGIEHLRFHDLRHSFATYALQSGADVKTLSCMLRHYSAGAWLQGTLWTTATERSLFSRRR